MPFFWRLRRLVRSRMPVKSSSLISACGCVATIVFAMTWLVFSLNRLSRPLARPTSKIACVVCHTIASPLLWLRPGE